MHALLIEDDASVSKSIALILKTEGAEVTISSLGTDGIAYARSGSFDLIVLDIGLPDMNGIDVLAALRRSLVGTPVMILSGFVDIPYKVRALAAGADEYLTKPFHKEEFMARLRAVVRRCTVREPNVIRIGKLAIDVGMQMASVGGRPACLTSKEFQLLAFFGSRPGHTFAKELILGHLYAGSDQPDTKIVDVFICKLRKKLSDVSGGSTFITTAWGRGYALGGPPAAMALAS